MQISFTARVNLDGTERIGTFMLEPASEIDWVFVQIQTKEVETGLPITIGARMRKKDLRAAVKLLTK